MFCHKDTEAQRFTKTASVPLGTFVCLYGWQFVFDFLGAEFDNWFREAYTVCLLSDNFEPFFVSILGSSIGRASGC